MMSFQLIIGLLCFVMFLVILILPKVNNVLAFFLIIPIAVMTGILDVSSVYEAMGNSTMFLLIVISMYAHLMSVSGFDENLGAMVEKITGSKGGKSRETLILVVLYIFSLVFSAIMSNLFVALALLPVINGLCKRDGYSRSKLLLFVIFASTIGGELTLIGTSANWVGNAALETAGSQPFGIFDFLWLGVPLSIAGGLYMILGHKLAPSYENDLGDDAILIKDFSPEAVQRRSTQKKWVGVGFVAFLVALVISNYSTEIAVYLNPHMVGFIFIAFMLIRNVFTVKEIIASFPVANWLFFGSIMIVVAIVSNSGLGDVFGRLILSMIGDSSSEWIIITVLFWSACLLTQFMNNVAAGAVLIPIGISIAAAMGASPRAFVMTIIAGATASYLTPMASGTNQALLTFTKLKFQDFFKFGWPLCIIAYLISLFILPIGFPLFP